MSKNKLFYQQIRRACVFSVLFASTMSFSQSIQAKTLWSPDTTENNQLNINTKNWSNNNNIFNVRNRTGTWLVKKTKRNQNKSNRQQWPDNGAPNGRRRAGAGRNPDCPSSLTNLTALVPGNEDDSFLTSTIAENPTFWFYVPQLPKTDFQAELVIQEQNGRNLKNIYEKTLPLSGKSGIISITTALKPKSLKQDKTYRWYFNIYCGNTKETSDVVSVDGMVKKVALSQTLQSQLATAKPINQYITYRNNQIWHDALNSLGQERRNNPQDKEIRNNWVKLLNEVGLSELADKPIVKH